MGRVRVPGLALIVALSVLSLLSLAGAPAAAAATPRCMTANLRLDFVDGQGFTSHRAWDFALRNVGSSTCRLKGYPGVGLLDSGAKLITVNVTRASGFAVRAVVLKPWQRAYFSFVYVVSGPCLPHYFSAYGLQVFPPNGTRRLVYYAGRFDVCSPSAGGSPEVYPIRSTLALSSAGDARTTAPCSTAHLKLQYMGSEGAGGLRLWDFALENTGSKCTLRGYPGLAFLNRSGGNVTGNVKRGTGSSVKTVTVAHGKRAYFVFDYLAGAFCHGKRAAFRWEVFPPGNANGLTYNPAGPNAGTVHFCPGSETVYPVNRMATP